MLTISTSIESAAAIKGVDQVTIVAKWKETANQERKVRAVNVPFEVVKAPDCVEQFRTLVESVLLAQAQEHVKSFVDGNALATEMPTFTRQELIDGFNSSGGTWVSKQELEMWFTGSKTWKRIISRPQFTTDKAYQAAANNYKDAVLKLSGKATRLSEKQRDSIIAKMENDDLQTSVGEFVVRRIEQMMKQEPQEVSFDDL